MFTAEDHGYDCGCGSCPAEELPVNPFLALRVAYGMLLGEEDLRVLTGQPRGKQMLHTSWLHGSGVVWGYRVRREGLWEVAVGPGLAIDGWGRELIHEATCRLDLRSLLSDDPKDAEDDVPDRCGDCGEDEDVQRDRGDPNCRTWTVEACLVAEFDSCLTAPVPILSDPCDVTRQHDDWSRVVEQARIYVRPGRCPTAPVRYPRVRMLFGLEPADPATGAGRDAGRARDAVSASTTPAVELVRQLRLMACRDSAELRPAEEEGECYPGLFPVAEEDTPVVLARLCLTVRDRDGCPEIVDLDIDPCVRTTLLPTQTITDLLCGQAPGLIGSGPGGDAGGARVIEPEIRLSQGGRRLIIPVTEPLDRATVARGVQVTSFGPGESGAGWVVEDIDDADYRESAGAGAIVVRLAADQPIHEVVRVIVRGTGPRPVMGVDAVPLAGLVGGPPGTRHNGHDAVWILSPEAIGDTEVSSEDETPDRPHDVGTEELR